MKIMVTGAFGLLGGAIQHSLPKNFEILKLVFISLMKKSVLRYSR